MENQSEVDHQDELTLRDKIAVYIIVAMVVFDLMMWGHDIFGW